MSLQTEKHDLIDDELTKKIKKIVITETLWYLNDLLLRLNSNSAIFNLFTKIYSVKFKQAETFILKSYCTFKNLKNKAYLTII